MGLIGNRHSGSVDPSLAGLVVEGTEKGRQWGLKVLAKNQDGIRLSVSPPENPLILTPYLGGFGGDMLFVVTDNRSIEFKNGQIKRVLRHDEVAETSLGTMPNGNTMVKIESVASRMDFRQNDPERFNKIIMVEVATPRIGNMICATVDEYLARARAHPAPVAIPPTPPAVIAAPQRPAIVPASWHPDPFHVYELRYWDGATWTNHVISGGQQGLDPAVR